ncbi:hypothetical protein ONZ45_g9968 [Pleurotus djamor]|nr:hypothetical protein ONZ45_g9968 [Pleurotus djamor]
MIFSTTRMLFPSIVLCASFVVGVPLEKRGYFVPTITSPVLNDIWYEGEIKNVTWDVSNPPYPISNPTASIYLRQNGYTDYANPLASNFDILLGSIEVVVPKKPGTSQVVLHGNSGNWSPDFTIL